MALKQWLGIGLGLLIIIAGWGCTSQPVPQRKVPLSLGNTTIWLVMFGHQPRPWIFFNMHDNENTAVAAGLAILPKTGGFLATLQHTGDRLIRFQLNDSTFVVDPNRIFTDAGIRATLEKYSQYSTTAHAAVKMFARELLQTLGLDTVQWVITLHNNGENEYSVRSYLPGAEYAADARAVYVNPTMDVDDFYFVTDSLLFQKLKYQHLNVVLQQNATVTDDGSLSVYCGKRGIPYVNVEAQHGHQKVQEEMIVTLISLISTGTSKMSL